MQTMNIDWSSESQGLGAVYAPIPNKYLSEDAEVGIITFGISPCVTVERTKGFRNVPLPNPNDADKVGESFSPANPNIAGLFSEWWAPGLNAAKGRS